MSNPEGVLASIHRDADDLDRLSKAIYDATDDLDTAEQAWDEAFDQTMQALEEEFAEAGRKSVPEHTALSAARREHRAVYTRWRNAKRRVERLQSQLQAKRAALNGRQSELSALRDELRANVPDRPASMTYGAVRAV